MPIYKAKLQINTVAEVLITDDSPTHARMRAMNLTALNKKIPLDTLELLTQKISMLSFEKLEQGENDK